MNKATHIIYIWSMVLTVIAVTIYMAYTGYDYYRLPIEERFYHPKYHWFKPSGLYGHGIGIIGTFMIFVGVTIYILRKRYGLLERQIRLKYLLEFHIFLCTLGPILVLFHTSFKFGGIVSIAFWSMVAVVLSGVIGRFIYIQIPRTIEGRALSLKEVHDQREELTNELLSLQGIQEETKQKIIATMQDESWSSSSFLGQWSKKKKLKKQLRAQGLSSSEQNKIVRLISQEWALAARVGRLEQMQQLFKYWHVAHLPFALIMLIIVIIHVGVSLVMGYHWIF